MNSVERFQRPAPSTAEREHLLDVAHELGMRGEKRAKHECAGRVNQRDDFARSEISNCFGDRIECRFCINAQAPGPSDRREVVAGSLACDRVPEAGEEVEDCACFGVFSTDRIGGPALRLPGMSSIASKNACLRAASSRVPGEGGKHNVVACIAQL